jgi:hypothetical protein
MARLLNSVTNCWAVLFWSIPGAIPPIDLAVATCKLRFITLVFFSLVIIATIPRKIL